MALNTNNPQPNLPPAPVVATGGSENDDNNDSNAIAGPTVAHITLAKTHCKYFSYLHKTCTHTLIGSHVYTDDLTTDINQPDFIPLIQQFLYAQEHLDSQSTASQAPDNLPPFYQKIMVYPSAIATFYSPSDISGVGGMCCECICAVDLWRKSPALRNCIYVETNLDALGMHGLNIACVWLFFSFTFNGIKYLCALMHWFLCVVKSADNSMGMWVVEPDTLENGSPQASIIHLDTIVHATHLLPVYKEVFVSRSLSFSDTLHEFQIFYVNKYVDHHAFKIAF